MGDLFQIGIVWFSANCTANNMTVGVLGPIKFGLGLKDAMLYVYWKLLSPLDDTSTRI